MRCMVSRLLNQSDSVRFVYGNAPTYDISEALNLILGLSGPSEGYLCGKAQMNGAFRRYH